MARLDDFDGEALSRAGESIRQIARDATSMEDASRRVVSFLYDDLRTADGEPALALARLYKTHPYGKLPDDLRAFARAQLVGEPDGDEVRCLTLLGTRGDLIGPGGQSFSGGYLAFHYYDGAAGGVPSRESTYLACRESEPLSGYDKLQIAVDHGLDALQTV